MKSNRSMVFNVPCPKCKAKQGMYCVKASGNQAETHSQRIDEYNRKVVK